MTVLLGKTCPQFSLGCPYVDLSKQYNQSGILFPKPYSTLSIARYELSIPAICSYPFVVYKQGLIPKTEDGIVVIN